MGDSGKQRVTMWKKVQVVKMGHALKIGSQCAKNGSKRRKWVKPKKYWSQCEKHFEKWDAVWKIDHSVKMGHSV